MLLCAAYFFFGGQVEQTVDVFVEFLFERSCIFLIFTWFDQLPSNLSYDGIVLRS